MNLHTVITSLVVVILFGSLLAVVEYRRAAPEAIEAAELESTSTSFQADRIVAAGRIAGRTASIELRARIAEQVESILAREGDWVGKGDVLVRLDPSQIAMEQSLAAAELAQAEAELERVENGYRDSEIQTARSEYEAKLAELQGAKKHLTRVQQLVERNAASRQMLDEHVTRVFSLEGAVAAAKGRLSTLEAPPRKDAMKAAKAAVAAAQSKLSLATIKLGRTHIRAPIDSRVLRVEAEVGELTGPQQKLPLVVLSDTRSLRVVAEVDEFDALHVRLGQRATITTDGVAGVLAEGRVSEIEPQMNRKELFSNRPGERMDSFGRRIWVDLDQRSELPIGLPVDVAIHASRAVD